VSPTVRASILGTLFYLLSGCSTSAPPLVPKEHGENLASILTAYSEAALKLQRPPNSLEELKPFLQKLGDPSRLLVSPHDGQPYEIHWGIDPQQVRNTGPGEPQPPLIVHERTGKNGIRYVATGLGVFRMADAEFEQARRGMKKP
jgi:hypothetical protein